MEAGGVRSNFWESSNVVTHADRAGHNQGSYGRFWHRTRGLFRINRLVTLAGVVSDVVLCSKGGEDEERRDDRLFGGETG